MKSSDDYSSAYWSKKISGYIESDWSDEPTPFALQQEQYLTPGMTLLELGAGAGQDSIWFAHIVDKVIATDAQKTYFSEIRRKAALAGVNNLQLCELDVTSVFPFNNNSIDFIYAQLVLHYFDDATMQKIIAEISRVLRKGGFLSIMVNTKQDNEYVPSLADESDIIDTGKITKRYFDTQSLLRFMKGYETIVLDDQGTTPKDKLVNNHGLVRFIGKRS